jgi:anti-anti-sigma regulatory factor
MVLASVNKPKKLLCLSFAGQVDLQQLERGRPDLVALLAEMTTGFRLLTDLSQVESIDVECAREIGRVMELCEQKGVGLVVRVIPDPEKDIGMNLLSLFHYHRHPRIVTCKTMVEAAERLGL